MASQVTTSKSLIEQLTLWGDKQTKAILTPDVSDEEVPDRSDRRDHQISHGAIFRDDFKYHVHSLSTQTLYALGSVAQSVVTLAAVTFCLLGEIYRL